MGDHDRIDRTPPFADQGKDHCQAHEDRDAKQSLRVNDGEDKAAEDRGECHTTNIAQLGFCLTQVPIQGTPKHDFFGNGGEDGDKQQLQPQRPIATQDRLDNRMDGCCGSLAIPRELTHESHQKCCDNHRQSQHGEGAEVGTHADERNRPRLFSQCQPKILANVTPAQPTKQGPGECS